jgi:hypothetical protein
MSNINYFWFNLYDYSVLSPLKYCSASPDIHSSSRWNAFIMGNKYVRSFPLYLFHNFPHDAYVRKKLASLLSSMTPIPAVNICIDSNGLAYSTECVHCPTCVCNL